MSAGRTFQFIYDFVTKGKGDIDAATKSSKDLEDQAAKTGKALADFGGSSSGITSALDGLKGGLGSLNSLLSPIGGLAGGAAIGFTGLAAGVAIATKEAIAFVAHYGEAAQEVENLASKIGVTRVQAEGLAVSFKIVGVSAASLASSERFVSQALEDTSGKGVKLRRTFEELGVSTFTASGEMREMGPVILQTLEKLSKIESTTDRVRVANELLGRFAAKSIQPVLENYTELQKVIERLHLSEDLTKELAAANRQVEEANAAWEQFKKSLAAKIAPIVIPIVRLFTDRLEGRSSSGGSNDAINSRIGGAGVRDEVLDTSAFLKGISSGFGQPGFKVIEANQARKDAAAAAFRSQIASTSDDEGAKRRIAEIKKEIQGAQLKAETTGDRTDYDKLHSEEKKLEAEIKARAQAIKDATAAEKDYLHQLEAGRKFVESLNVQIAGDQGKDQKIVAQTDKFFADHPKVKGALATQINDATQNLRDTEALKELNKFVEKLDKDLFAISLRNASGEIHKFAKDTQKDLQETEKEARILERSFEIGDSAKRADVGRAAGKAERIVGLIALPGQEKQAIETTFAIQIALAQQLEQIDLGRIRRTQAEIDSLPSKAAAALVKIAELEAAVQAEITKGPKGVRDQARIDELNSKIVDLREETGAAAIRKTGELKARIIEDTAKLERDSNEAIAKARENRELDFLALQRRGIEDNRRLAESFTASLFGGKDGVSSFFANQGKNLITQIGGNVLGPVFTSGTNAIKGVIGNVVGNDSFLGKALGGTILDPKTAVERNITSLDRNTLALQASTGRLGGGGATGIPFLDQLVPSKGSDIANLNALGGGLISDAKGITGSGNSTIASLKGFLNGGTSGGGGFIGGLGSISGGLFSGFKSDDFNITGVPGPTGAERAGNVAASGAAVLTTGISIYDGIKKGGAQGISQAIGSGLALAALADPEPISKAVLTIGASIAGAVSYFAGKGARDFAQEQADTLESRRYNAPVSISQSYDTSTGMFGDSVSYDTSGRARGLSGARHTTVVINAMDGESVMRVAQNNRGAFATAVASVVRDGDHPISADIRNAALGFA